MSDELPEIFRRIAPQPAPSVLRQRVLSAVAPHLARRKKPRWERIVEWSVAASLAFGVGLNVWQLRSEAAWQTRVLGPMRSPAAFVKHAGPGSSVTKTATGQTVKRQLSAWSANDGSDAWPFRRYQQLLNELKSEKGRSSL